MWPENTGWPLPVAEEMTNNLDVANNLDVSNNPASLRAPMACGMTCQLTGERLPVSEVLGGGVWGAWGSLEKARFQLRPAHGLQGK